MTVVSLGAAAAAVTEHPVVRRSRRGRSDGVRSAAGPLALQCPATVLRTESEPGAARRGSRVPGAAPNSEVPVSDHRIAGTPGDASDRAGTHSVAGNHAWQLLSPMPPLKLAS
eukprot:463074-Hanusia_phi.AAC.1